jgi:DNA-binding response OmpR family regulator
MGQILIIDSDEGHAREVVAYLESRHYSVKLCHESRDAIDVLRRDQTGFDVLIVYISGDRREEWAVLDSLRTSIIPHVSCPGILCVLRANKGPNVILVAERKGARCVIEE